MVVHLAAAAHHVADTGNVGAVACAAGNGVLLEDVDVAAGHLRIANQIAGRTQRRQAGSDDVGALVVDSLGLLGACKSFVVSAGVIHEFPHFRVAHQWFEGKAAVSRACLSPPLGSLPLPPVCPGIGNATLNRVLSLIRNLSKGVDCKKNRYEKP